MGKKKTLEEELGEKENEAYREYYRLQMNDANIHDILYAKDKYDDIRGRRKVVKYENCLRRMDKPVRKGKE